MTDNRQPPDAPKRAVLPRELSEVLIELSIGVHRYAMYPPEHPSLEPVVENIVGRLADLFADRDELTIGVARRQLVIQGIATDPKHAVLSDLAERLRQHQLAAVSFEKGVRAGEISGLPSLLSEESERGATPVGLRPPDEVPTFEHAAVHRVGYEHLELQGKEGGEVAGMDRATALWLGLARAAMGAEEDPEEVPDPAELAGTIQERTKDAAYDEVIVGYLRQLADELKSGAGGESEKIRQRVSGLLQELDDDTLTRLVNYGGDASERKRFLLDANQSLAVDSVMKVIRSAAAGSDRGISDSMTRMLNKLARHTGEGGAKVRSQADTALRENAEALIEGWDLKDPNPESYTGILDSMSKAAPVFQGSREDEPVEASLSGGERLIQMALEVEAFGPTVERAVLDVLAQGGTARLLNLLEGALEGNEAAIRIREYLMSPARFRDLVAGGQLKAEALQTIVEEMGEAAVEPLLDVLAESDSRSVRRSVFDALARLGPAVGERTLERLEDSRWFVLWNMLALLQRLQRIPEVFDPQRFLDHSDHRVRREALPLAIQDPAIRERALAQALADDDDRMVRMALLGVQEKVPEAILPTVVNRVVKARSRSEEIRALGAKVLRNARSPLAMNALLDVAAGGRSIFGGAKVAPKSPLVLAALGSLATAFPDAEEVRDVLQVASRSKDPAIREAVRPAVKEELDRRLGGEE